MKTNDWFRLTLSRTALALILLSLSPFYAAGAGKPYRVGIVLPDDEWASSVVGLKEGLKALGYGESKDVVYLFDNAKGDKNRISETAKKFVADKVDAIYTVTNTALKIVIEATRASKTPVVFGSASGPAESGVVKGYVTPDTHVTGVTSGSIELVAKRLEILKEVLPSARKIAAIGDLESDSSKAAFLLAEKTSLKVGLALREIRIKSKDEAVEEARQLTRKETDAIFLIPGLYSVGAVNGVAAQARSARIPFAVYQIEHVRIPGALLSYGSSYHLDGKQSAALLDKVLKGTQPGQLPIERPRQHQLVLNLDTAMDIGIKFSPQSINRADEIIGGAKR